MSIVAERFSFVVGVDTHARSNTYAIIATRTAARLDAATFPTSSSGIGRALGWILRRCQESRPLLVVEGIGSYGAALRCLFRYFWRRVTVTLETSDGNSGDF